MPALHVTDTGIVLLDVSVESRDVAAYFTGVPEPERLAALVRAVEVGVFCLERAQSAQDLEFVRRQVDGLLASVQTSVSDIPANLEKALSAKLGTGNGQVLAPVKDLVDLASKATTERIDEVRTLLSTEIDPGKDSSTLGRALISLRSLLDPARKDSVQSLLDAAVRGISSKDGAIAVTVAAVVKAALDPLVKSVDALNREVVARRAAEDALAGTTAKGATYEEEVVSQLQVWAKAAGAEVHHVGPDNQPGDVVVHLPALVSGGLDDVNVVVEARDRQSAYGRKQLQDCMSEAMHTRGSSAGVYVSRSPDGLAREIGDWAEGQTERGPWVATQGEHLVTAVRFILARVQLARMVATRQTPDLSSAIESLRRISTSLERVTNIHRKTTTVRTAADEIQKEADLIRSEVRDALRSIEETLRLQPDGMQSVSAA